MRHGLMAAALMIAAPASAQVTLETGQGISLAVDGTRVTPGTVHPAALGPHDLEALDQMRISYKTSKQQTGVLPPVMMSNSVAVPDVVPGRIDVVFVVFDGKDSVLAIVNGDSHGFTYRARITRRGATGPTDVCLVLPGKRGYEHWPYPIDRIELSAFELVDWNSNGPPPCR